MPQNETVVVALDMNGHEGNSNIGYDSDNTASTSVDIGDGASGELVDKFCCLSYMLSVHRDVDTLVNARVRKNGINLGTLFLCLPIIIANMLNE